MGKGNARPPGYWTHERCKEHVSMYSSIGEMREKDMGAWGAIYQHGWTELFEPIRKVHQKPNGYWNIRKVANIARKYSTRKEFKKAEPAAFSWAEKHHCIDDICKHMEIIGNKHHRCIYAFEFPDNHVYVGLTYNASRREWEHLHGKKHSAVRKYIEQTNLAPTFIVKTDYMQKDEASIMEGAVLDEYIAKGWIPLNIKKTGALGGSDGFSDEEIMNAALQCETRGEFRKRFPKYYNVATRIGLDRFCSHMPVTIHKRTLEEIKETVSKCKSRGEFQTKYKPQYLWAFNRGLIDELCKDMKPKYKVFTDEHIKGVALLCKTSDEFKEKYPEEYHFARRRALMRKLCPHFYIKKEKVKKGRKIYCDEDIWKVAILCKSRYQFCKKFPHEYDWAAKHHRLDEFCKHMVSKAYSSSFKKKGSK